MAINTILNLSFLCFLLPGHYLWKRGTKEKMVGLKISDVLGEVAKKYLHKVGEIVL